MLVLLLVNLLSAITWAMVLATLITGTITDITILKSAIATLMIIIHCTLASFTYNMELKK